MVIGKMENRELMENLRVEKSWDTVVKVLGISALIYVIETWSYFMIATYFGSQLGADNTWNMQLPIDRVIPWVTPLYLIYIPWPIIWYFVIPLVVLASTQRRGFARYTVNSLLMYVAGSIIYAVFPTTTTPHDFIDGTIMTLDPSAPFYSLIEPLSESSVNIWGSFPSYHNYWASILIVFGLMKGVKLVWRVPMVTMGVLISLSTLTLHQHCVMDVVLTYAMTLIFLAVTVQFHWDNKLLKWLENERAPRPLVGKVS
jgi:hypothetical protein